MSNRNELRPAAVSDSTLHSNPDPIGAGAGSKRSNVRWWILAWLLAATMLNYMDRSSVSIAAPHMIGELGLTRADIGALGTAFSFTYAICQLPAGWITDRLGARPVYAFAVGVWSLATALMGLGHRMWHFIAARILLGVFEAPIMPTCAKITAEYFPPRERGAATGVFDSGSRWGPAVAPPILTALTLAFGWRAMFATLGLIGIMIAVGFAVLYRSPAHNKRMNRAELEYVNSARTVDDVPTGHVSWGSLFGHSQTWAMILGFVAIVWSLNIYTTFLPLMLNDIYHLDSVSVGWFTAIPFAAGGLGGMVCGWGTKVLGDRLPNFSPLQVKRRAAIVYALCLAVVTVCVPLTQGSLGWQLAFMSLSLFFGGGLSATGWSMPSDVVTKDRVASLGSIQNFGGWFAGALSPIVTGSIATATGSYSPSFFIGAAVALVGAVAYGVFLRGPIKTPGEPSGLPVA